MENQSRLQALTLIKENINRTGSHLYVVSGGAIPRFAYTIGLWGERGCELILAGGLKFMMEDVAKILNSAVEEFRTATVRPLVFGVEGIGRFSFRLVHESWSSEMLLGALDYYEIKTIEAFQVVPEAPNWTIDIPDLSASWSPQTEPIWQWLRDTWPYSVPKESTCVTNLAALQGSSITEVSRWSADEWEAFAGSGPDVSPEDIRVAPLGTLLASDPSLDPIVSLEVGKGLWREGNGDWNAWG